MSALFAHLMTHRVITSFIRIKNTTTDTGLSCFAGGDGSDWQSLHPFLTHYQTKTGPESCSSTGTSGSSRPRR